MPDFTDEELLQIIESGEADRVEFKESLSSSTAEQNQSKPFARLPTICPRHEKPGFVFVGVKNNRTIAGLPVTDELLLQLAHMKNRWEYRAAAIVER